MHYKFISLLAIAATCLLALNGASGKIFAQGYCSPSSIQKSVKGCTRDPFTGAGKCTNETWTLGCYPIPTYTCMSDQYAATCENGLVGESGVTWCSFPNYAHASCGTYVNPSCDANSWSNWTTCSASCGGGVQYSTNDCGNTVSRTCNTHACPYGCFSGNPNYCARAWWGSHSKYTGCMNTCTPQTTPSVPPSGDPLVPTPTPATPPPPLCPSNAPFLCLSGGSCCRTVLEGCTCAAAACSGDGVSCLRDIDATGCHNTIRPEAPNGYYFCTEDKTCSGDDQGLANANCFDYHKKLNPGTYNAFCCGGPRPPPPPLPSPTNLVASCKGIVLDKTSTIYGYAIMEISWDAVPGAVSYALRVDDNNPSIDRIVLDSFAVDTCDGHSHDVCVATSQRTHRIFIANPAQMDNVSWWVSSIGPNNNYSTLVASGLLYSCIPNCQDIEGPATIEEGQTAVFSAIFKSHYAQLRGTFSIMGTGAAGAYTGSMEWPGRAFGLTTQVSLRSESQFYWDTTGLIPGIYTVYCRAWNDQIAECRGTNVDEYPRFLCNGPTATHTITVTPKKISIPGQVWIGNPTGNACQFPDINSTKWSGANTMTIRLSQSYDSPVTVPVQFDGSFTITNVTKQLLSTTANITLGGTLPAGYIHRCPASGVQSIDVSNENPSRVDFYIYDQRKSWWQATGGNIFSKNAFAITIPADTCLAAGSTCDRYLLAKELNPILYSRTSIRNSFSAGVPITGGAITGTTSYLTDRALGSTRALLNNTTTVTENYAYFSAMVSPENASVAHHLTSANGIKTIADFTGTKKIGDTEIYYSPTHITLAPSSTAIAIPNNRKIVVFVNGNLTISPPGSDVLINSISEGGNLIFIVNGNIVVDAGVGRNSETSTVPVISGIFIANGTLTVASNAAAEKKFVAGGSFIAHSGVVLNRDFNTVNVTHNKVYPTELFIFRPDLVKNFPDILKSSTTLWKEVN